MKLIEALRIIRAEMPKENKSVRVSLVCGFTPLHLKTLLAAHLRLLFPHLRIDIETGIYGDLLGNLKHLDSNTLSGAAVVVEWTDLDPRLGIRHLGGWGPKDLKDIIEHVRAQCLLLGEAAEHCALHFPLAVCLPTLPLPPASFTAGWQAGAFDLELRDASNRLATRLGRTSGCRLANCQYLDRHSPPDDRWDVKADLLSGFPYAVSHADVMAHVLAQLLANPLPKKGLITDLDDTLWSGILGEVGVHGISWDLDHGSQMHGVYQQLLNAISQEGVLVAVASKNNPALVQEALRREDLLLSLDRVFPFAVHWGPKSESVTTILQTWNVAADSVVFVDDSPMELAEVGMAHPGLQCLHFPKNDWGAIERLLGQLRDLFGKTALSAEDALRMDSLRIAAHLRETAVGPANSPDQFLQQAEAEITLSFGKEPLDPRALELVNKTNQFNLNGKRYTETSWSTYLKDPRVFLLLGSYRDKYGPLGKITVLTGRLEGATLQVDTWVMSCRAFVRRIEHKCLEQLFSKFEVKEIRFQFLPTERNEPLQRFFTEFLGQPPQEEFVLSRQLFMEKCPPLFHCIKETKAWMMPESASSSVSRRCSRI